MVASRAIGPASFLKDALMFVTIGKMIRNEDGATAIEYGLIAALIAVAAITAFTTVGTRLSSIFNTVANNL